MNAKPASRAPVAEIDLEQFSRDPYPIYARLRAEQPIAWIPELEMYFVTRYDDVKNILHNAEDFIVGTENSTIYDTFGKTVLTVEGKQHIRYRSTLRPYFMPRNLRDTVEAQVRMHVDALLSGVSDLQTVEFRSAVASRLPILTMLSMFGLPLEHEPDIRRQYDSFEAALSNFSWDEEIRQAAARNFAECMELIQNYIDKFRAAPHESALLSLLANAPAKRRLSDEEIQRNVMMVFFGGISTVEALLLNVMYALDEHPETFSRIRENHSLIAPCIEETARWMSPVQSATRHVIRKVTVEDVTFEPGETVNCMLAAANRDPKYFDDPDTFNIDRADVGKHLAFAAGVHHCLGNSLARAEARIFLESALTRMPDFRCDAARPIKPEGYEFRQPRELHVVW